MPSAAEHYLKELTEEGVKSSSIRAIEGALSGQITVTTAGTAVQGPNVALSNGVYIGALDGNADTVYVGNDGNGDVSSATGFQLSAGQYLILQVANLNLLYFDAASNGDKLAWIKA